MHEKLQEDFRARYGTEPILVMAPGRVNLIGEHTDYNEGFVLPAAVDKRVMLAIAPNNLAVSRVYACQYQAEQEFSIEADQPQTGWINYFIGVNRVIRESSGRLTGGVDVMVDSDIPVGAGMSSSAALCSGFGFGLNHLFSLGLNRLELALVGQQTEHRFAGVQCGIMDQFASLHGKKGHVIKLDCRSLEFEYIPFDYPDVRLVLANSMVSHSLAATEYNLRRQQCEAGVSIMRRYLPDIRSLRDVSFEQLARHWQEIPAQVYDRCSYVINENQRLLAGCDALRLHDLRGFGEMMFATHKGLSKRYGVSCRELDFLVEVSKAFPNEVLGARMMGGGFGGCTLNIVQAEAVPAFCEAVSARFREQFGQEPELYVTQIEDGVRML